MKTNIIFLAAYIMCSILSAQSKIVVDYEMRYNIGQPKVLDAVLEYGNGASIFLWNNTNDESSIEEDEFGNSKFYVDITDSIGTVNYIDFKKDSIHTRSLRFREVLMLKEKRTHLDCKIESEEKVFGNYTGTKATTKFRGRTYVAWFTSEIPIGIGPWKITGLPGLILEVHDEEKMIHLIFKKITKSTEKFSVDENLLKSDREVDIVQYQELQKQLANDMVKKIMAKMPRGASISVDNKSENFLEKEFE